MDFIQQIETDSRLGLTLCRASRNVLRYPSSPEHSHPFFELAFVSEGFCDWIVEGRQKIRIKNGQMLLLPPSCFHYEEYTQDIKPRVGWIGFEFSPNSPLQETLTSFCYRPLHQPKTSNIIDSILEEMLEEQRHQLFGWQTKIRSSIVRLLILLHRSSVLSTSPPSPSLKIKLNKSDLSDRLTGVLNSAAYYLQEHCHEDIQMAEVARYFHLSPSYFSSVFQKKFNLSPKKFLLTARLNKARALLEENKLTHATIAESCGFYDEAHFNRFFKNHLHCSPGSYQKQQARN